MSQDLQPAVRLIFACAGLYFKSRPHQCSHRHPGGGADGARGTGARFGCGQPAPGAPQEQTRHALMTALLVVPCAVLCYLWIDQRVCLACMLLDQCGTAKPGATTEAFAEHLGHKSAQI